MSPTATAAQLIGGHTIESAAIYRNDDTEILETFSTNASLAMLACKYSRVRLLCIDEVSMLGCRKFHTIHKIVKLVIESNSVPKIPVDKLEWLHKPLALSKISILTQIYPGITLDLKNQAAQNRAWNRPRSAVFDVHSKTFYNL
jgi:hypothetical protein